MLAESRPAFTPWRLSVFVEAGSLFKTVEMQGAYQIEAR
jgi:hypothetical protein